MAPLKIGFNARELKQHGVLERMKAGKLNQLEAAGKLSLRRHQLMAAWDEARMKRPACGCSPNSLRRLGIPHAGINHADKSGDPDHGSAFSKKGASSKPGATYYLKYREIKNPAQSTHLIAGPI